MKHARLRVTVFDPDTCTAAAVCPKIYDKDFKVDDGDHGKGRKPIGFELKKPIPVSAYTVAAELTTGDDSRTGNDGPGIEHSGHKRLTLARKQIRFGVRQAAMDRVPDNVLKGDVPRLNVEHIRQSLESCAKHKTPTVLELSPTNKVRVVVERVEVVAPGVNIPGLGTPIAYRGRTVKDNGDVDQDSVVDLHLVNGTLSGTIMHARASADPTLVREQTFIDPESSYHSGAEAAKHVVYRHKHTVPPFPLRPGDAETFHPTPATSEQGSAGAAKRLEEDSLASLKNWFAAFWKDATELKWLSPLLPSAHAQSVPVIENYTLRVAAYEHFVSNSRTQNRYNTLVRALTQMQAEFQGVRPLTGNNIFETDNLYRMSQYWIIGWKSIPETGYSTTDTCANVNRLEADTGVQLGGGTRGLHILFSALGKATAPGCARRSGSWTAIMDERSNLSWDYYVAAIMQELGHNLDGAEDRLTNYDPHLDRFLGEVFPGGSCTAMRLGYAAGCDDYQIMYARDSYITPRERLIHGLPAFSNRDPVWVGRTRPNDVLLSDVGVGMDAAASVWAIGRDIADASGNRRIYKWNPQNEIPGAFGRFEQNGTDANLRSAVRVAVDSNGVPWVVTAAGAVFRKANADINNIDYVLLPNPPGGGASDIGIGGGQVWVIGRLGASGFGSISYWDGTAWQQVAGEANRIAVDGEGTPWVIGSLGRLFRRNPVSGNFDIQPIAFISDVGIGGEITMTTNPTDTYVYETDLGIYRKILTNGGVSISVGSHGSTWAVTGTGAAFSTNFSPTD